MARHSSREHLAWYVGAEREYAALANTVALTLQTLLRNAGIDVVGVHHRAKSQASFAEKIRRKRYLNPKEQMTDLAGVRIITLIERDVDRASDIARSAFDVHAADSLDKSTELGLDRFGYRSVHLVCDIGSARAVLPEFQPFKDLPFEIQIRTALQHAWAEIEHDRSYKFSGELPSQIKRRFHLVAGLLELADKEFSNLTEDLERYTTEAHKKVEAGDLDFELNSTTALELLKVLIGKRGGHPRIDETPIEEEAIVELRDFGVESLHQLRDLLTPAFFAAVDGNPTTSIGLIRDAMMFADIDKYFSRAWKRKWQGWDIPSVAVMRSKFGPKKVDALIQAYSILLEPDELTDLGLDL